MAAPHSASIIDQAPTRGVFGWLRAGYVFMGVVAILASPARAATYCEGTIDWVLPYDNGAVMIQPSWRNTTNSAVQICNLNTTWNAVSPEVCRGWLGIALTAVSTRRQTMIAYWADIPCTAVPLAASAPAPAYVSVK